MTDYDATLRAAVTSAAHATVAPPFGAVERRARARRHRQVAAVAFAAVAVVGAAALAAPGGTPRGQVTPIGPPSPSASPTLKPYGEIGSDPDAQGVVAACLATNTPAPPTFPDKMHGVAERTECYALAGYRPPPIGVAVYPSCPAAVVELGRGQPCVNQTASPRGRVVILSPESAETSRCWTVPEPGAEGVRTVGRGSAGDVGWYVVAWTEDGTRCVSFQLDPRGEPLTPSADMDSGPDGALRPLLAWDLLRNTDTTDATIWWGALSPDVVRVEWEVGGETVSHPTVDGGDRRYLGVVLTYPDGTRLSGPIGYDAQGRRVTLPSR